MYLTGDGTLILKFLYIYESVMFNKKKASYDR